MKKLILSLSVLSLIAFTSCKDDATKKIDSNNVAAAAERDASADNFPVMEFNEVEHDFGEIDSKQHVTTEFVYTNKGEAPLIVTDIKSTCGCTVPQDWSRDPLAPGESAKFSVTFNGSGSGNISKTINITANTATGKEAVKIKAFVKPDPNAPARTTPTSIKPTTTAAVKSSTQPGHEGHNHD
ncbi:MAG: DUF1573 domain-containing protein [Mangrovimonas sp.]|nr:DUF1573 domain-containing protein [Mangrovimonas sp.]